MKSLSILFTIFSAARGATAVPPPGPDGKYTLTAEGIRAQVNFVPMSIKWIGLTGLWQFIPFGAAITNLFVEDKNGVERDIVVGFDNAADYPPSALGHFGEIPGRYAGRIGNGQYTIDGVTYSTEKNNGNNTLHSGNNGWGFRTFEVVALTEASITFHIRDASNSSIGMLGDVDGYISYTLTPKSWKVKMSATAPDTHKTPLMLTQHTYWSLDAFSNPTTDLILDHSYYMPFSQRILEPDPNMLPTGQILSIPEGDINDFWSKPKLVGTDRNSPLWKSNCGDGCEGGYNNCWIVDKLGSQATEPVATLSSGWSGIKVDIYTDQVGMQVYSCNWVGDKMPIKKTQGGPGAATNGLMKPSGCIALEAQDWSDGINHPEWGRKQVYGPGETYIWEATYKFSTLED
ncbi:galactose mutarotase-like domain-containing protein [Tuber borchii]|uniref:Galactose mutarotase-like domain-containing protein n=1 Tax=Tuber borchii TaxID=42251 RepID=A0A2T6ZBH3_TUBBO|nr:galactose mutarotase-like domain-containing protein [Tuber borchii]